MALLLLRVNGYIALVLLCLLVMPSYHPGFRLGWRALAMFFCGSVGSILIRLTVSNAVSLAYNDWALTPILYVVLWLLLVNLRRVQREIRQKS